MPGGFVPPRWAAPDTVPPGTVPPIGGTMSGGTRHRAGQLPGTIPAGPIGPAEAPPGCGLEQIADFEGLRSPIHRIPPCRPASIPPVWATPCGEPAGDLRIYLGSTRGQGFWRRGLRADGAREDGRRLLEMRGSWTPAAELSRLPGPLFGLRDIAGTDGTPDWAARVGKWVRNRPPMACEPWQTRQSKVFRWRERRLAATRAGGAISGSR